MVQVLGNGFKILIACVNDAANPLAVRLAGPHKLVATTIEAIRTTTDKSARKNAAIVLARLARHPPTMQAIRDLRGMEILMSLGKWILG